MGEYISQSDFFPNEIKHKSKLMVFVDGENFAIRYKNYLKEYAQPDHVQYYEDIFLWSKLLNSACHNSFQVIRKHYYTSVFGDTKKLEEIEDYIKNHDIDAPRVFKKKRNGKTKKVDISLATEMLHHATKQNYDTALLIAGDEDYVPLVKAVQSEGCRVIVWFFSHGISRGLKNSADRFIDITRYMRSDIFTLV